MMDKGFAVRGLSDAFSDVANSPTVAAVTELESPKGHSPVLSEVVAPVQSPSVPMGATSGGQPAGVPQCEAPLLPPCSDVLVSDQELATEHPALTESAAPPQIVSSPPIKASGLRKVVLGADEDFGDNFGDACALPAAVATAVTAAVTAASPTTALAPAPEAALVPEEAPAAEPVPVPEQDVLPPAAPTRGEGFPSGGALEAPEHVEVQDFSAEPIEQRFCSKDINRRCSAYAEVQEKMTAADEAAFAIFKPQIGACIGETLPKAQDAALGALAVYLSKCPGVEDEQSAMLPLVRQLIEHKSIDKPKFQQSVSSVVLCVAEICECPSVLKEMTEAIAALDNAGKKKSVGLVKKSIAFVIRLTSQILAEFGPQKMPPKLGYVQTCLERLKKETDRAVKDACFGVLVELSCWLGDISDLIKEAEKAQKDEVANRIGLVPEESKARGEPKRLYRGEKRPEPGSVGPSAGKKDQFDLMQEVDALKKLPKDWAIAKVFSTEAWKERQAILAILSNALEVARLANSDGYADIVHPLIRILKTESNIPILQEAAKCVGLMAKGLRKEFDRYARQCLSVALGRMQDKSVWKPHVLIGMTEHLLWSFPFEFFVEEVRPYAKNKSPFVKSQAVLLLIRSLDLPAVQVTCPDAAQRFLGPLADIVLLLIEDSDNLVRQEGVRCLVDLTSRNLESTDIGPLLLEKIPSQRRKGFEDEWRKTKKDLALPPVMLGADSAGDGRVETIPSKTAPMTPRDGATTARKSGSRQASPKGRQASPSGRRPEEPPASKMPAPRATAVPSCSAGTSASGKAVQGSELAEGERAVLESRCRELEAEVSRLRGRCSAEEVTAAPSCTGAQSIANPGSSSRVPSNERAGTLQPRPSSRPTTPTRTQTPTRHQAPPAERTRRLSDGSGCSSEPGRVTRPLTPQRVRPLTPQGRQSTPQRGKASQAVASSIRVDPPKFSRETRQHKELGQYWGPDHVPAEFLAALKESLKPCLDSPLLKSMFSEKMDELLKALQAWKRQAETQFSSMDDILDLVLKWLTWVFFMTNTQVLKLALEVLGCILHGFEVEGRQLTDREAQILLPNLLERSGHNNSSIRDMMYAALRQVPPIYSRIRLFPFCVLALASKNKRTVAASMLFIGELLSRQVAVHLLKTPKDMDAILKLLTDKDAEARKASQQTVASLSQHMDSESFSRVCERVTEPSAKQAVRQAAARLPSPAGVSEESDMMEISAGSADQAGGRISSAPTKTLQLSKPTSTLRTPSVPASPGRRVVGGSNASAGKPRRPESPGTKVRIAETDPRDDPLPSDQGRDAKVCLTDLSMQLGNCSREEFRGVCDAIVSCVRRIGKEQLVRDAPLFAQALLDGMKAYFGAHSCATRCWPLVDLLGEMCGLREFVRCLPEGLLRGLLRELLKHLYHNNWTTRMDDGSQLLRKMNLACVMLLNSTSKPSACQMLLDLGMREHDTVGTSLVGKCLKKLNKNVSPSAEAVESLLNVVYEFARTARKQAAGGTPGGERDHVVQLLSHAREAVEAVRQHSPEVLAAWHGARQAESPPAEDEEVLQDLLGNKENPTEGASPCPRRKSFETSPVRRESAGSLDARQALSPGPQQ